ncbi:hypothetical protein C8R45DRAFT_552145 [Mycena sanguinolenta]|nr:hypothetical protein C8R45DRAFT_552145 [Mycena sanguinolenta]
MLSVLAADRARVAELDAQIRDLERSFERAVSELRSQKAKVQDRLDSYKYPVLTLPDEMVVEIFVRFLPDYPSCPPLVGLYSPFLLAQICRQWRRIASETPALWRAIAISDMSLSRINTRMPFKEQAHLFNLWLSRSQCCPLSMRLDEFVMVEWVIEPLHAAQAISVVLPHRARWENLELELSMPPAIEGPMPLLRRLDLWLGHGFNFAVTPKLTFHDVPLLRTVLLNGIAAQSIALPWAQLTSLALRDAYLQNCLPILRVAINLLHCRLGLVRTRDDSAENLPRIAFPRLQSLALVRVFPDLDSLTGYLPIFDVPALRRLRVAEQLLEPNPIDSLTSFISRARCPLQELCVTDSSSKIDLDSYLEAFPSTNVSLFHGWGSYPDEF